MGQKPITISVIAAITVAAILMPATISSTNQAFAQQKPTTLTINVSPTTVDTSFPAPISITGKLTSEGSGVDGATITFTAPSTITFTGMSGVKAVTDADGTFSTTTRAAQAGPLAVHGTVTTATSITAHYAGDATHMSSNSPSKVITFCYMEGCIALLHH